MLSQSFSLSSIFNSFVIEAPIPVAVEAEPKIYVGDVIYFVDEETGREDWGIFEGFYCDLNEAGETSPYWHENMQRIHRLRIREADGRANYILPENVYALSEVEGHVFEVQYGL
jgi:hypothetical protein